MFLDDQENIFFKDQGLVSRNVNHLLRLSGDVKEGYVVVNNLKFLYEAFTNFTKKISAALHKRSNPSTFFLHLSLDLNIEIKRIFFAGDIF